ncbi:uncharacterized protein [Spinacia oleracea]|uniref:Uncharacterized protein n=1 Tax=Spinacia oleracea TaxID=3562 RepID=A0ABM3R549_SPIOL|nr:uncharacterized protein LOC130466017 [Spinacia oleracea]
MLKFSVVHRKDIKMKKNPAIMWIQPQCPRQAQGTNDSGYYVCRYMQETISKRQQLVPPKYFPQVPATYSQPMIDEICDTLVTYFFKQKQVINDQIHEDEENDILDVDHE